MKTSRQILGSLLLALTAQAWAQAQTPARIAFIGPGRAATHAVNISAFRDGMRENGLREGEHYVLDEKYAKGNYDRFPTLTDEVLKRNPAIILVTTIASVRAAQQATKTVPIVFVSTNDPVGSGLVASLARPTGNVTGISSNFTSLAPKRLQLLREILPKAKRIGDLIDPNDPISLSNQRVLEPLVASLGMTIIFAEASNPVEFEASVAKLLAARVDAIFAGGPAISFNLRARLIELTNQKRVPVIGAHSRMADAGALISYGFTLADHLRRSALLVDKILKGAKPADLPVEQPNVFELVVNLKAAKALGITIPQSVLISATRVIE